jgi:hypothetical protein
MNNDSPEYINQAYNLIHHGSFYAANWDEMPHLPEYYSMRPPGYSLLVLVTLVLTGSPWALLIAQSVLSILLWMKLHHVIQHWYPRIPEKALNRYLLLALCLNPVQMILCNSIFSDILFQTLISLAIFSLLDFFEKPDVKPYIACTAFLVLALLTKPALVYFAWIHLAFSVYLYFRVYRKPFLLWIGWVMPMVVMLVSLAQYRVTGYYHYSCSKVFNLWAYNTTNFLNMKYGNDSGFVYKSDIYCQSMRRPTYREQYRFVDSACTTVIARNATSYALYHAQGMVNFFLAPGREYLIDYMKLNTIVPHNFMKDLNVYGIDGVRIYLASQPVALLLINFLATLWNLILMIALVYFVFYRRIPWIIRISLLIIIAYFAGVSSLALGTARYRLAIYPMILFCAAIIPEFVSKRKETKTASS